MEEVKKLENQLMFFAFSVVCSPLSDARSITVGFPGVLFPLSSVEEPLTLDPLRAGIPQICGTGSSPPQCCGAGFS